VAEPLEPIDLGSWLASLGAPESFMGIVPQEVRDVDISSVLKMLGSVGSQGFGSLGMDVTSGSPDVETVNSGIRWLPIMRD